MTTYANLLMHLTRHEYMRGAYKGDAPADRARRGKSHFRVRKLSHDRMAVRFHNTDILTAYENGSVTIDCRGWGGNSTTKDAVNDCNTFTTFNLSLYSRNIMSHSQLVLRVNGEEYAYYDGMSFDKDGNLMTERKGFEAKRIDKAESKEFMQDVVDSGFKDAFALLYATCKYDPDMPRWTSLRPKAIVTSDVHTNDWVQLIHLFKFEFERRWDSTTGKLTIAGREKDNAKACWSRIMKACKSDMYKVTRTEVVSIK